MPRENIEPDQIARLVAGRHGAPAGPGELGVAEPQKELDLAGHRAFGLGPLEEQIEPLAAVTATLRALLGEGDPRGWETGEAQAAVATQ